MTDLFLKFLELYFEKKSCSVEARIPARFEIAQNASIFMFASKFFENTNIWINRTPWRATFEWKILKLSNIQFWFKYYSSPVITPDSARYLYPNKSQILSFFRVAKRGWVIRRNLISCFFSYNFNQQKLLHTKRK